MSDSNDAAAQVIADMMRNLPSPIAAEPIEDEPDYWRSCAPWSTIIATVAPRVLDALKTAGYQVVALPEPSDQNSHGYQSWDDVVSVGYPGSGKVRCYVEDGRLTPQSARELAAALLAAADEAEADR